jgi:hypothetical protein
MFMSARVRVLLAVAAATSWALTGVSAASASPSSSATSHYKHIFVIVMENHSFTDVIGNPATPNLNALAKNYGIATNYFAVTHPSEPNYVALLGGSPFTVSNDNAYYVNRVAAPSLISELESCQLEGLPSVAPPRGIRGDLLPVELQRRPRQGPALRLQARRNTEPHNVTEHEGLVAPGTDQSAH